MNYRDRRKISQPVSRDAIVFLFGDLLKEHLSGMLDLVFIPNRTHTLDRSGTLLIKESFGPGELMVFSDVSEREFKRVAMDMRWSMVSDNPFHYSNTSTEVRGRFRTV